MSRRKLCGNNRSHTFFGVWLRPHTFLLEDNMFETISDLLKKLSAFKFGIGTKVKGFPLVLMILFLGPFILMYYVFVGTCWALFFIALLIKKIVDKKKNANTPPSENKPYSTLGIILAAAAVVFWIVVLINAIRGPSSENVPVSTTEDTTIATIQTEETTAATTATTPEATTSTTVTTTATTATPATTAVATTATTSATATTATVATTATTATTTTTQTTATTATTAVKTPITVVSLTSPISAGQTATIKIQGKPNTQYTIQVKYKSGYGTADGLGTKMSDTSGYVSWTWEVGAKTSAGTWSIEISGGGEKIKVDFVVTK